MFNYLNKFRFAHSNSPIESYNNQIKSSFTCRIKFHMIPLFKIFQDLIVYESKQEPHFQVSGSANESLTKIAYSITHLVIRQSGKIFEYTRSDGSTESINTATKVCSCSFFFDKAMCSHLIAASIIDGVDLPGLKKKVINPFIYESLKICSNFLIIIESKVH